MNIGIDIDGTFTKYPDFFVSLARAIQRADGKVFIITGLGEQVAREKLLPFIEKHGHDWFDSLVTTANYNERERRMIGLVPHNEMIVGTFKQRICQELNVAVMFDDQAAIHRLCGPVPIFEVR